MGIRHRKVTPELPRANGQAESFMKVLAKAIRSAKAEDRDWRQVINQVLRCYRSTPHSTTGKPPAELLFGRATTARLPTWLSPKTRKIDKKVRAKDQKMKEKSAWYNDS